MARLELRLDENEKILIKDHAQKMQMTISDYIRQMALRGLVVYYRSDVLNELIVAINRIGVNINQIAKMCNEERSLAQHDLIRLQIEHANLFRLVADSMQLEKLVKLTTVHKIENEDNK